MLRMNKARISVLLLLLVLLLAAPILAQISTLYDLSWHLLSGGGGPRASSHYQIDDVLGQWPDGQSSSAQYQIDPGFWHAGRAVQPRHLFFPVVLRPRS